MKTFGLIVKKDSASSASAIRSVVSFLEKKRMAIRFQKEAAEAIGLKKYSSFDLAKNRVDLIIVFGGDGTILSLSHKLKDTKTPLLGINTGTLGFMSEIPPSQIHEALVKVLKNQFTIDNRLTLKVEVFQGKKVTSFRALNDAVISQGVLARMITLEARVNGMPLTTYQADGLIVATPTGSTAYSLSAGGPILHPRLQALILTPICPHSFTQKPIVLPAQKIIEVKPICSKDHVVLTIDGQQHLNLNCGDVVRFSAGETLQFVRLPSESFFKTLKQKLSWGEMNRKTK